jgi:hypothetical protein
MVRKGGAGIRRAHVALADQEGAHAGGAQARDIRGRSKMGKWQLIAALRRNG